MMTAFVLALIAAIAETPAPDAIQAPAFYAGNEELAQYIKEALQNSPDLKGRFSEWRAMLEKIPQVTALDDPMLRYSDFTQTRDKRFVVGLEQKFPWFGTLRARGDRAMADADAALAKFYAARNGVIADVKRAYFTYALLGENIKIATSQAEILVFVEQLVRSRYALGMNTEADLLRIQVEKGKLKDNQAGLEQSRAMVSATLAQALGREAAEEIPWPQETPFPTAPPPAPVILAQVRVANPDLTAIDHIIDGWRKEGVLAKKRGYPDITLGIEVAEMKENLGDRKRMSNTLATDTIRSFIKDNPATVRDFAVTSEQALYDISKTDYQLAGTRVPPDVMVTLQMSLPIWRSKINAGIQEAAYSEEAATHDKRKLAIALETAVRTAVYRYEDAQRRYSFYKESLIPKAVQTYQSLQASYGTGATDDFVDLLESVRTLQEFKLEQVRAATDTQTACAELEYLMGGPWQTTPSSKP